MSVYSATCLQDSPALYWRLAEPSGTNANDETANNRDGTYVASPTLASAGALTGDADTAVDLNGTTQYITSTYAPFSNAATRSFEFWGWRDTSVNSHAAWGGAGGSTPPVLYLDASQNVVWQPANAGFVYWAAAWPGNGQWVHCVFVFNESTDVAELFLNGASQGQKTMAEAYAAPGNLRVGAYFTNAAPYDGKIDEFAVYESALSAARIKHHYNVGKGLIGLPKRRAPRAVSLSASGAVYR